MTVPAKQIENSFLFSAYQLRPSCFLLPPVAADGPDDGGPLAPAYCPCVPLFGRWISWCYCVYRHLYQVIKPFDLADFCWEEELTTRCLAHCRCRTLRVCAKWSEGTMQNCNTSEYWPAYFAVGSAWYSDWQCGDCSGISIRHCLRVLLSLFGEMGT